MTGKPLLEPKSWEDALLGTVARGCSQVWPCYASCVLRECPEVDLFSTITPLSDPCIAERCAEPASVYDECSRTAVDPACELHVEACFRDLG